jgi:GAF domain-containing protein
VGTVAAADKVLRRWTPLDVEILTTLAAPAAAARIALRMAAEEAREVARRLLAPSRCVVDPCGHAARVTV